MAFKITYIELFVLEEVHSTKSEYESVRTLEIIT